MAPASPLQLDLPDQIQPNKGNILLDPRQVEAWLAALPMANVGEASRQVFQLLVESNRTVLPDATRLRVAGLLSQPVEDLVGNLHAYFMDVPLPLSAKRLKVAELCRELCSELAVSYQILVKHLATSALLLPTQKKTLAVSIRHALFYLERVLLESFLSYNRAPPETWRNIHQLFGLATAKGIDALQIQNRQPGSAPSIRDQYTHLLLFSLASPYRLRQKEIRFVYDKLAEWVSYARLGQPRSFTHTTGLFAIEQGQSSPPMHIAIFPGELTENHSVLNTRALARFLKEQHDAAPEQTTFLASRSINQPSKALLAGLIRAWSLAPQRRFARFSIDIELTVVTGLTVIHSAIQAVHKAQQPIKAPVRKQQEAGPNWLNPANLGAYQVETVELSDPGFSGESLLDDLAERYSSGPTVEADEETVPEWTRGGSDPADSIFKVHTINESANGYLLHWDQAQSAKIKVGELLGIYSVTKADQLGIGVVRWVECRRGEGVDLGVELLAPYAEAVDARRLDVVDAPSQMALLLPKTNVPARPETLITSPANFKSGNHILLVTEQTQRKLRLTRRLDASAAFVQFQFIELDALAAGDENTETETPSDFDSLWSEL